MEPAPKSNVGQAADAAAPNFYFGAGQKTWSQKNSSNGMFSPVCPILIPLLRGYEKIEISIFELWS